MKFEIEKVFGFTMAEVLVTLGLVGVVAAMTLSMLMPRLERIRNAAILKRAYSDIAKYIDMFYLENTTGSRAKVDFQILGDENVKNVPRFFYEILIETEETDEKTLEKEFARFCSLTENNAVTKLSVKQIKVTFASDLGKFSDTVIKMYGMSYPFE